VQPVIAALFLDVAALSQALVGTVHATAGLLPTPKPVWREKEGGVALTVIMAASNEYWFRAKRYGWGWGVPLKWQGWAALALYALAFGAGVLLFPLPTHVVAYVTYSLVITALLIAVCYWKGEPPKWRWGRD